MGMLDGKVAIVTGSGAGIGRGVALALAKEGTAVTLCGRRIEPVEAVKKEIEDRGARALAVRCDVRELADVENCVAQTVKAFGRIDILVNNAQTYRHALLSDVTDEDLDSSWRSGPLASFRFMKLCHPYLRDARGVVVNVGSNTQLDYTDTFHVSYSMAKGAIQSLTRYAAVEWGKEGIRAFIIFPAADSPQLQAFAARDPTRYKEFLSRIPLGRWGDAEKDIGGTIAWLVSSGNTYMTGAPIMLDGGQQYVR
jgi:NAD(P)-dependent dehydrogenase (short-subunit alcohol dehydrogenase family)